MKRRKSPYRHRVKAHKRLGRPVKKYMRGTGNQPTQPTGRRKRPSGRRSSGGSKGPYVITLSYVDLGSETLTLDAPSYLAAVNPSLEKRKTPDSPYRVRMRRVK